jgi:hypothetical protein
MSVAGLGFRPSSDNSEEFLAPLAARHRKRLHGIAQDGLALRRRGLRSRKCASRACTVHEIDHLDQGEFGRGQGEASYRRQPPRCPRQGRPARPTPERPGDFVTGHRRAIQLFGLGRKPVHTVPCAIRERQECRCRRRPQGVRHLSPLPSTRRSRGRAPPISACHPFALSIGPSA